MVRSAPGVWTQLGQLPRDSVRAILRQAELIAGELKRGALEPPPMRGAQIRVPGAQVAYAVRQNEHAVTLLDVRPASPRRVKGSVRPRRASRTKR